MSSRKTRDAPRGHARVDGRRRFPRRAAQPPEAPETDGAARARRNRARFRPSRSPYFWALFVCLLILNWVVYSQASEEPTPPEISYSAFLEQVDAGNVSRVVIRESMIEGRLVSPAETPEGRVSGSFATRVPSVGHPELVSRLLEEGVVLSADPPASRSLLVTLALSFGPTFLFIALLVLLFRWMGGSGGLRGLGRSRARKYEASDSSTTFADVAGIEEAKAELVEIVDFLRNPGRYTRLGGEIPKGVLLSGPPGTGKTLLARAVAGEAGVPFYSLSASEFVEMVAGVGASRVRDLFKTARDNAPAIVFVDELDAVGRRRGSGNSFGGGSDEREQTLNQILTEMDGFSASEGIVVIAATNRPEILDSALLRPGRFDRRITVGPPDLAGRKAILAVHTRGVPLAEDADLQAVAADTPGMVGADLRNLVNEAALAAVRDGSDSVGGRHFSEALERIVLGAERRLLLSVEERRRTAYHEAGHALLGMIQPGGDPVRKISIVPRGHALGITLQRPDVDRYRYDADFLYGRIVAALGGRAAEELVYGGTTTGAENDIEIVTDLARQMVGRWGMSEAIGPVALVPRNASDAFLLGPAAPSERTRELMDAEVRRLIEECYQVAITQLRAHRDQLEDLTAALLERETLDEREIYEIAGMLSRSPRPADDAQRPSVSPHASIEGDR